jgi:uncharacterized protein YukE
VRKHAWLLINLAICAAMVAAGYGVVVYRQNILDWWTLRGYTPPANIVQIADQDTMVGRGRDLFYVSQPQIEGSEAFNQHCSRTGEKTVVLGCYFAQRIYVYDVTDPRLEGVKQVTAAHEMLHAAYERLDAGEKSRVNAMLQAQLPHVTDDRLKGLIAIYSESEPGELLNEMHSILGTEYSNLSPELEVYYKQYFSDRSKVVVYATTYQAAFTASQAKITQLQTQLDALKKQIDANTDQLNQQKAELDAESAQLNTLRGSNPAAYNQVVPSYNARARAYNNLVVVTRNLIEQYNALVTEHNNEAAAQNGLYHSLDSRYQTVN